jgi:hypothetical protein
VSDAAAYIIAASAWSVIGFFAGALFVRVVMEVHEIRESVVASHTDTGRPKAAQVKRGMRKVFRRLDATRLLGILLLLLALATTLQTFYQTSRSQALGEAQVRLAQCQIAYQNGFADALDARTTATNEAQQALDELVATVAQATGREASRAALARYIEVRERQKRTQESNPYPPAPRDVCKVK